jgi:hypothetical protein
VSLHLLEEWAVSSVLLGLLYWGVPMVLFIEVDRVLGL